MDVGKTRSNHRRILLASLLVPLMLTLVAWPAPGAGAIDPLPELSNFVDAIDCEYEDTWDPAAVCTGQFPEGIVLEGYRIEIEPAQFGIHCRRGTESWKLSVRPHEDADWTPIGDSTGVEPWSSLVYQSIGAPPLPANPLTPDGFRLLASEFKLDIVGQECAEPNKLLHELEIYGIPLSDDLFDDATGLTDDGLVLPIFTPDGSGVAAPEPGFLGEVGDVEELLEFVQSGIEGDGSGDEVTIMSPTSTRQYEDRNTTFPFRTFAKIRYRKTQEDTTIWNCTGFLVYRNTIMLAGHCLHSGGSNGHWFLGASYRSTPGLRESSRPYGHCQGAKRRLSQKGWVLSENPAYDWGLLIVTDRCTKPNPGNHTGWMGHYGYPRDILNAPIFAAGYVWNELRLTYDHDIIRGASPRELDIRVDGTFGWSGGPIYDLGNRDCGLFACYYGVVTQQGANNVAKGTRMNDNRIDILLRNRE